MCGSWQELPGSSLHPTCNAGCRDHFPALPKVSWPYCSGRSGRKESGSVKFRTGPHRTGPHQTRPDQTGPDRVHIEPSSELPSRNLMLRGIAFDSLSRHVQWLTRLGKISNHSGRSLSCITAEKYELRCITAPICEVWKQQFSSRRAAIL